MKRSWTLAAIAASALAVLGMAGPASATSTMHPGVRVPSLTGVTATATTVISNHPDGGNNDNAVAGTNTTWANDNFTRTATIRLVGEVTRTDCPATGTGHCYLWDAKITDKGTFTVNPTASSGAKSPRTGLTLDTAVTGAFGGGSADIQFYSSWKTPSAALVPKKLNNNGVTPADTSRTTTTNWVEQFFGSTADFNSAANPGGPDLGDWAWMYTATFGANKACPNDAYQWVDSAANNGGQSQTSGDILTPDAADCT